MVNRQTQLSSGGTVLVRESVLRGSGPQGPQGERGDQGPAIYIVGVKADEAAIKAVGGTAQAGHAYGWIADDTGILWVWYRDNPDTTTDLSGSWSNAGRMRGNPGYLNSVAARGEAASKSGEVHKPLSPNHPTVLLWNLTHVDTEVLPTEVVGGEVVGNSTRPIVIGWRVADGSNAQATVDVDRIAPAVPPAETALDYPFGSSVFMVHVSCDFAPAQAITKGTVQLRLVWTPDGVSRQVVATQTHDITARESTLTLTTFVRGLLGGQYEVEVESDVYGSIQERRWEWIRAGGGPGPKGDTGEPGDPPRVHPSSPVNDTDVLDTLNGDFPGQLILTDDTGVLHMWQAATDGSGYLWVDIGVVRGPAGDANTGFSSYDAVVGANLNGGTSLEQGVNQPPLVTTDQQLPYPDHDYEPRTPFFFTALLAKVEQMLVGRFGDATDRTAKRQAPQTGSVSWVGDTPDANRGLDVYAGDDYYRMAMVIVKNGQDAPAGTGLPHPDGTLWIRYG